MSRRVASLLEALTALSAVVTLPVGILTALFLGLTEAAVVFVVGWFLLTPVFGIVGDVLVSDDESDEEPSPDDSTPDPLEALKRRYANGEIDEAEFERRLERLVATDEIPPEAVGEQTRLDTDATGTRSGPSEGVESIHDSPAGDGEPVRET